MRNMSFSITTQQMKDFQKDVTRRLGWWFLKEGDLLMAVEKCQGLKKGDKVKKLYIIEVLRLSPQPLYCINKPEVIREGFPDMTSAQFVEMFCKSHKGCTPTSIVNRIHFRPWGVENHGR